MFLEVLVEGGADVPTIREILQRRFNLIENTHFCIHPHKGKGKLPQKANAHPKRRGLLDQLPAKLRAYSHLPDGYCIVVVVDADNDDCKRLKESLITLYRTLKQRPACVLFRIAVEETESWFLADKTAIKLAFPHANLNKLPKKKTPDSIIGAWEKLAEVLGKNPSECDGKDKFDWARTISPYLDLEEPNSPSLKAFIDGIARVLGQE
jgi:hypothetical protein